jgi:hypothetical protein
MTSTAVSPFVVSGIEVVELADDKGGKRKLWKKQILPAGTKKYKGQELDFSKINPAVVQAFDDKAFDAVPFVMSLTSNEHPQIGQEGELIEGDLEKLELAEDGGLFGYFDLSHSYKVLNAIRKSKGKFGVSGRVEVDYVAEDTGKTFPYALSHVCGTTRPHIKGMSPWEAVDLSEVDKDQEDIDFSSEVIEDKPTPKKKKAGEDLVPVEIPKDKLDRLLQLVDELDIDDVPETSDDTEKEVPLSKAAQDQIAAAEKSANAALELAEKMQVDAAQKSWAAERSVLLSAGVPPVILDLAGKVLSRHKPVTLEFGEDDTVDASEVIREMLDESTGVIKLGEELGHSFTDNNTPENKEYLKLEEAFGAMWEHDGRGR